MRLIIAEKPSVGTIIANALNITEKKDGYYESDDYIISWCIGHLVEAYEPKDYSDDYKYWKINTLPIIPDTFKFKVSEGTKKQYKTLASLMNRKDVAEIICATDCGREGESIFRLVYNQTNCKKGFKRLWTSSLEEKAILTAMKDLKNSAEFDSLYKSALCREQADWIIGINASRLFSLIKNETISIGRVQTPTLALIVNRDIKIKEFKKEPYYNVQITANGLNAISERIDDKAAANQIKESCNNQKAVVVSVEKITKNEPAPKLYDLTTLQREANRFLGFTAKQTLDITQALYEAKLVTYPRTDSKYITDDMKESVLHLFNEIVERLDFADGIKFTPDIKSIVNNAKVSDHFAVLPTENIIKKDLKTLEDEKKKILYLILQRFLASLADNYSYTLTTTCIECNSRQFTSKNKIVVQEGFKEIENRYKKLFDIRENKEEDADYDYSEGQEFEKVSSEVLTKHTSPPKKYTEDSLLSVMDNVVNEEYLDETVEKKGLGTPATRAAIIEKLIGQGFIARDKRQLVATEKGVNTISSVPEILKSPKLTAEWETKLQAIERNAYSDSDFLKEAKDFITEIIENSMEDVESPGACPNCNEKVLEDNQKYYCSACHFSIWKNSKFFSNKKITLSRDLIKEILTNGRAYIEGVYSEKKNKSYNAFLVLDNDSLKEKYVNFKIEF